MTTQTSYEVPEEIFILYGGSSADGRGEGDFESRTADPKVAYDHWRTIKGDPYSTGCVQVLTDQGVEFISTWPGNITRWKRYGFKQ